MTIKRVLLVGALGMAPAVASSAPHIVAVAAHPGKVHVKTPLRAGRHPQETSTISVTTGVSTSSDYKVKTPLPNTFYSFLDSDTYCNSSETQKIKLAVKKTAYAKLSAGTETFTGYCSTAPTVFYGDVYDLRTKKAKGKKDHFRSTLVGKHIRYNGHSYNFNIDFYVTVAIGT